MFIQKIIGTSDNDTLFRLIIILIFFNSKQTNIKADIFALHCSHKLTSRSEYRLLLRQDNADRRLCPVGYRIGLVSRQRLRQVEEKYAAVEREIRRLEKTGIPGSAALNDLLTARGTAPVADGCRLIDLLRRPQVSYEDLRPFDPADPDLPPAVREQVEITYFVCIMVVQ